MPKDCAKNELSRQTNAAAICDYCGRVRGCVCMYVCVLGVYVSIDGCVFISVSVAMRLCVTCADIQ